MFEQSHRFPISVSSSDMTGIAAAFVWAQDHRETGAPLTVWTHTKQNFRANSMLRDLTQRYRADHVTGRGGAFVGKRGPVIMAFADPSDVADFTAFNASHIAALCVISWVEDKVRPWALEAGAELLEDTATWHAEEEDGLEPIILEAMRSLTSSINHNNTISAGFEKDHTVSVLLALHDAGYQLGDKELETWAAAHGWSGKNGTQLSKYARDITAGKRPRARSILRADYIDQLRAKVGPRFRGH